MRTLAIDPGTHCGFATWDGQHVESGVWDFSGDMSWAEKWLRFQHEIVEVAARGELDVLVYEEQQHIRGRYALLSWGWQVVILMFCRCADVRPVAVNASTLKKWATGSGRASKADMIVAARERFGVGTEDDNEADAVCLLSWAREQFGKEGEDGT